MAATRARSKTGKTPEPEAPAPTLVIFVRHGKTPTTGAVLPGRAPGLHLSEDGHAQAAAVAARIGEFHTARKHTDGTGGIAAVYASPLERTQETAAPIARAVGARIRTRAGLLECDFGDWTGRKLGELAKLPEWRTVQRHPSGFRFPRGESFPEMQARMVGAVNDLAAAHPGEAIVAVSHADTIKAAVAAALGTPLDLFQRIVVGPCSASVVLYSPAGPTVLAVNHTADLVSLTPS